MMKKGEKKLLKTLERAMRNEVVYGIGGFPPVCSGILHQPKRPDFKRDVIRKQNQIETGK